MKKVISYCSFADTDVFGNLMLAKEAGFVALAEIAQVGGAQI